MPGAGAAATVANWGPDAGARVMKELSRYSLDAVVCLIRTLDFIEEHQLHTVRMMQYYTVLYIIPGTSNDLSRALKGCPS